MFTSSSKNYSLVCNTRIQTCVLIKRWVILLVERKEGNSLLWLKLSSTLNSKELKGTVRESKINC